MFLQITALILTGSISGFLSLFLVVGIILTLVLPNHLTKITLVLPSHYTKLTLFSIILIFLIMISGLFYLRSEDLTRNRNSITERIDQYKTTKIILSKDENIISGIGTGNFVENLMDKNTINNTSIKNMQPWQKQPVHNVFALIFTENGIIGMTLFLLFFIMLIWQNPLVISLLPILFLDHYLWTAQQGMFIFIIFIIMGLFIKINYIFRKNII